MIAIKAVLITILLVIFYQDARDRLVYWFLFPLVGLLLGMLHYQIVGFKDFVMSTLINFGLILFIFLLLKTYAVSVRGYSHLKDVLGLGDICMILALGLGSGTVAFLILLVFGLVFALVLHVILRAITLSRKQNTQHTTVPLAGYLSIFFGVAFVGQWSGIYNTLYIL